MAGKRSTAEEWARGFYEAALESAKGTAPYFTPGYGTKELTPEEVDTLWDERVLSDEQIADLWRQGLTPEEIGVKAFPNRLKLMMSGGRVEPKDQHAWVNKQAKRMVKKRQTLEGFGSLIDAPELPQQEAMEPVSEMTTMEGDGDAATAPVAEPADRLA